MGWQVWGSCCADHEGLSKEEDDFLHEVRKTLNRYEVDAHGGPQWTLKGEGKRCSCPMNGRRAPELALGAHLQVLERIFEIGSADILASATALQENDRMHLLEDLDRANAHIFRILTQKLHFGKCSLGVQQALHTQMSPRGEHMRPSA